MVLFLLASLLGTGCAGGVSPAGEVKAPSPKEAIRSPKAAWEQKWENFLAGAKKEGEVLIYTNINPQLRTMLYDAFQKKHGINLGFVTLGSGSEVYARAASEKRAGIYLADVFIAGATNVVFQLKPEGLLAPLEPVLILPEILDRGVWRRGELPFSDNDRVSWELIGAVWGGYARNTDLVKEGEITSYLDVLKPIYKEKITLSDPLIVGSANTFMAHLAHNVLGMEKTAGFIRDLLKQEPAIIRDRRLHAEWVARGKYAIGIGPDTKEVATFMGMGAPLALVWPIEGAYLSSVGGAMGLSARAPHPNAAVIFINWLLTKEGQTLFSQGFGFPVTRIDVPPGVNPKILPPPDLKVFPSSEDWLRIQANMVDKTKEIFTALGK